MGYTVSMEDSIFTQIIKGAVPCHKIYEDDRTIAFLDIHPVQPGHVLVVPKTQVENFYDLDEQDAPAFWATVHKVGKHLSEYYPEKKRIGIMLEGLDIPHAHAKLFPIDTSSEYRYEPDMSLKPDHEALAKLADELKLQ